MAARKGLRRYRGWIAVGALMVVAVGAYLALKESGAVEQTVTYETEAATLGTISVTVSGTGNVAVNGTTEVWSTIAGTVATVAVAEGSVVATGDVLFTLDDTSAAANTAKALASLRQAQQSVAQAALQIAKAESALASLEKRSTEPSSTVSDAEIAGAEGDVEVAEAGLASARAQVTVAQLSYDDALAAENDLTVTAPCGAVVHALDIAVGDPVSASGGGSGTDSAASNGMTGTSTTTSGAPLTLAPEQPLAVHLTVNEIDLPSLQIGQRATIEFDALSDLAASGKVYDISDEGTNSSGVVTFDVWLSIDAADPALRSGMSTAATIVTQVARNALTVSNSALNSDGDGGYYVLVLDAGAAEPRQVAVETGLAGASKTQILSGISEGDIVVTQTVDSTDSGSGGTTPGGGMIVPGMGGGGFRG